MKNKKVLFIAPRFHTNQFFLTKQLIEKNVDVNFLSIYIGASENHEYLEPIVSKPSRLINWFLKNKNGENEADRKSMRLYHITSFFQCISIYKNLKPDIVIIRDVRWFISKQHFIISILLRKRIFLYSLTSYRQKIDFKRKLFYGALKLFGIKHYTPVKGYEYNPTLPNTLYIPFIMEKIADKELVTDRLGNDGIRIITIGKMQKRKNIKELVESLFRIGFFNKKNNTLSIVSECIEEKQFEILNSIKAIIKSNETQIVFHMNVAHDKVPQLLKDSDLFVLPSHNEPAGTSIHEAMACGLAVVCSNSNGTQWYVENGVNGYVFNYSEDFVDLDAVLLKLLDKKLLVEYGLASLRLIEQNHGIEKFYNHIIMD